LSATVDCSNCYSQCARSKRGQRSHVQAGR